MWSAPDNSTKKALNKSALAQTLLAAGAISLMLVGVLKIQHQRLQQLGAAGQETPAQLTLAEQQEQLRLSVLQKAPSFGFDNLVANWTFLGFLQYFGNVPARSQLGYRLSPEYFEVIVKKDPYFITPYLFLSTSTSLYAALPERSVGLMAQGLASMTPAVPAGGYLVWRYKGIDQLLFLGDGAAARESFETSASWADQSSDPQAAAIAQASRQTAEFLAQNPASKAAQISAWVQVINLAVDQQTQDLAVQRIQALGGQILVLEDGQVTVQYRVDQ
jgi:hypothetical protein